MEFCRFEVYIMTAADLIEQGVYHLGTPLIEEIVQNTRYDSLSPSNLQISKLHLAPFPHTCITRTRTRAPPPPPPRDAKKKQKRKISGLSFHCLAAAIHTHRGTCLLEALAACAGAGMRAEGCCVVRRILRCNRQCFRTYLFGQRMAD